MRKYYEPKGSLYAALYKAIELGLPVSLLIRFQSEIVSVRNSIWSRFGAGKVRTEQVCHNGILMLNIQPVRGKE